MSAATDALEEINELLMRERKFSASEMRDSELTQAVNEIRRFTDVVAQVLNRPDPEPKILPLDVSELQQATNPEITEILRQMRSLSSAAVAILDRPIPSSAPQFNPAPVVHVEAPSVNVTPSIRIEQPARRWRFTVTQRDQTAQQRIKEIIVESLE